MLNLKSRELSPPVLAFVGDAIYEKYIRIYVVEGGSRHADLLHRQCIRYVCAEAQAKAIKHLMEGELYEDELSLVRRARNHKNSASKKAKAGRKGSDPMVDKHATAFEALIGTLYIDGNIARMEEIILRAIDIIEND